MNKNFVYCIDRIKSKVENNLIEKTVLRLKERELSKPRDFEILVRHDYIGLNFFDLDVSRGLIKKPDGFVPGIEATGVIESIGKRVKHNFKIGDRVSYCALRNFGSYSHYNAVHEDNLIYIPDDIQNHLVSGFLMRGIFTHALLKRVFKVDETCCILIFNPTGALGHILSQWANYLMVKVIGVINADNTAKTIEQNKVIFESKKKLAESYGCNLVLNYSDFDFETKIMDFTKGFGINVVYDSIGNLNLLKVLNVIQYCGLYVSLGQNSGVNLKISMQKVMEKSIFITRPSLFDYKSSVDELRLTAVEVFNLFRKKILKPNLNKIYKFENLKESHQDLINRDASFINILEV
jgi:NADPH2:quinone reductase